MKKLLFAMLLLVMQGVAYSQDANSSVRHYLGKVKYQKTEQDATIFELPYPKDEVEDGMKKMLGERGIKPKERNGFYEARNAKIVKLNDKVYDVYYKIEKDGKTSSKISMILAEPGEDLAARNSSHAVIVAAAGGTALAASVGSSLNDNDHDLRVKDQEAEIKSTEKKYQSLLDDQKKLQKKMTDLQTELDKNTTDQGRLQQELEAKKKLLEDLKGGKKKD
jgi:hypothetical protein